MQDELLQPGKPYKFTSRNPRTHYKRLKTGEIFLVEVEIEEAVWNALRTVPENAIIENVVWYGDGDVELVKIDTNGSKKEHVEKGPHSAYWNRMFKNGFYNYPALVQKLECAGDQIRLRLHDIFEVKTLSDVSPEAFEKWMEEQPEVFASLITMSRLASVIAERKIQNENQSS